MNRSELVSEARVRTEDNVPDGDGNYKISSSQFELWADEAVIEACRRSRLLFDNTITVSLSSGRSEYDLPCETIFIRRAKISSEDCPLIETSYRILDEDSAGWETHTGTPTHYFTDMHTDYFSVYPTPDSSYTLKLMIVREPIVGENIEMPSRFHYGLVDWMLFRYYQVPDSDIFDKGKSLEHLALFKQEFGERSSAKDEIFQLRNRPFSGSDGTY